jgi:hypothetical protein
MSSHREAPEISRDPVADNTDLYAFVSPDNPSTVTIIANFIPLQGPAGGPNFYAFGDDVLYEILIDNDADALPEITYQFRFTTTIANPNSFLYNSGPITSLTSANWNNKQTYSVTRVNKNGQSKLLASNVPCPPCNVGPRSTPNYSSLAQAAITTLSSGETVFAGQRAEGFYVDLGSIFDLGDLRPFQNLQLIPTPAAPGVNATQQVNVHTIAIQIPKTSLTSDHSNPTDWTSQKSVIGVWATASRQKTKIYDQPSAPQVNLGPFVQVSRLGNPLINEVIIPLGSKDVWNTYQPSKDSQFVQYYNYPELAGLIPVLYPGVFPNLAALTAARADLVAILLTGIPQGLVPNFQNYTGTTQADMLRLNMAIAPTTTNPSVLGVMGGDLAGYPNGRRVFDDVVTIELRAIAGVLYPLVDPTFVPDGAASLIDDFNPPGPPSGITYLSSFPYLNTPYDGYDVPSGTPASAAHRK